MTESPSRIALCLEDPALTAAVKPRLAGSYPVTAIDAAVLESRLHEIWVDVCVLRIGLDGVDDTDAPFSRIEHLAARFPMMDLVAVDSRPSSQRGRRALELGVASYLAAAPDDACDEERDRLATVIEFHVVRDLEERQVLQLERRELEIARTRVVELRELLARSRTLEQLRGDFLTLLGHEIRTPLTSMLGFSEVLDRGLYGDEEELREILGYIHQAGLGLSDFVTDALELYRWYAGTFPLEHGEVELSDIVLGSLEWARRLLESERIPMSSHVPDDLLIEGDAGVIEAVFRRILGTAVQFSPRGSALRVQAFARDDGVLVEVIDDGVSVDPRLLESMLRPLESEGSLNHHSAGHGLHLALAKEAVEAHGGDLTVTPKTLGLRVSVRLPLRLPRALRGRFGAARSASLPATGLAGFPALGS